MPGHFAFGALAAPSLLQAVLGEAAGAVPAWLEGRAVQERGPGCLPSLAEGTGRVDGLLLEGLSAEAERRLAYWATVMGGSAEPVAASVAEGSARLALAQTGALGDEPAEARDGAGGWAELWAEAAGEILSCRASEPAERVAARLNSILSRAWTRIAAARAPLRPSASGLMRGDIDVIEARRPYSQFFAVEEYDLTHRRFDGSRSAKMTRAVFLSADAVTVLPYDPVRDTVLLVEQMRVAPLARGDGSPWLLEPVAGRIEPGHSPEDTARKETLEEAGLTLGRLFPVGEYYASTGSFTEYIHSYVGLADLPPEAAGLGGLATEHEDIRGYAMTRAAMMALLAEGGLPDGPLLLTAWWLEANLDRVRGAA